MYIDLIGLEQTFENLVELILVDELTTAMSKHLQQHLVTNAVTRLDELVTIVGIIIAGSVNYFLSLVYRHHFLLLFPLLYFPAPLFQKEALLMRSFLQIADRIRPCSVFIN